MHLLQRTIIILLLTLTVTQVGWSQQEYRTGLVLDDSLFRDEIEAIPEFSNDGQRAGDLPRRFSLRPYTPIPQDQGSINSCVGWAMGYAALTTQRAYERGITNKRQITSEAYSAMYIYNDIRLGNCDAGARISTAAGFLKNKGTCLSGEFDYPYDDCDRDPSPELGLKSVKNAITESVAVFTAGAKPKAKIMKTKRSIAGGKPVVVGLTLRESIKNVNRANSLYAPQSEGDPLIQGGHAVCVIGYNDSLGIFEIMNSWGQSYGDGGYFRMSYRDFNDAATMAIQLVLPPTEPSAAEQEQLNEKRRQAGRKVLAARSRYQKAAEKRRLAGQAELIRANQEVREANEQLESAIRQENKIELALSDLAGNFKLRFLVTDEFGTYQTDKDGEIIWEIPQVRLTGNVYELNKKDWEIGDQFQVIADNIKKDSYVYLFSLDGENKLEVHWPRNERAAENLKGYETAGGGSTALVTHSGAEITIPGPNGVLTRENLLDDHLVILYAKRRINDFRARLSRLRAKAEEPFEVRFQTAFGDLVAPPNEVKYDEDRMWASARQMTDAIALPIIVRVSNE